MCHIHLHKLELHINEQMPLTGIAFDSVLLARMVAYTLVSFILIHH